MSNHDDYIFIYVDPTLYFLELPMFDICVIHSQTKVCKYNPPNDIYGKTYPGSHNGEECH